MELRHLSIENFRNLERVEVKPGPRFNIFSGPNGHGKTNLLEAVYLLSAVKSLRGSRNADLIRWGATEARIEGLVERAEHERTARVRVTEHGKRVALNDQPVRNLGDFFGTLNTVVFAPDDLMILKGSPGDRRRFLDRAVFSARAGYLADVQAYEAVLRQRNAWLKDLRASRPLLEVYNGQLADLGARVALRRLTYLIEFRPFFQDTFRAIFFGDADPATPAPFEATLALQAKWLGAPALLDIQDPAAADHTHDTLRDLLLAALQASEDDDRRRGFTTRGPHRDDLVVRLGQHDARAFASQGQMRSIVLAMKVAQIRVVRELYHHTPILLLDDVSSELDRDRNRHLFDVLRAHPGQVFITTTHRDHIQLTDDVAHFTLQHGAVTAASDPTEA